MSKSGRSDGVTFEVLIPKENINHFFNILQFLGKIGRDVIVEVDVDLLTLRSLNDPKSAFASVELSQDYFQIYELLGPPGQPFACKMAIKPLCAVLKNSKKMQSLRLYNSRQETGEMEMIFAMGCNHGILRTHRFIYQETDVVTAMFDESSPTCSRLRCQPKVLAQLFGHIHHRLVGEVSIDISRSSFKVKTFHSDRGGNRSSLHDQSMASVLSSSSGKSQMTTEMCLDPRSEFDVFEYQSREQSQEIIVCCKEIKSLLWFSEASEVFNLNMLFTEGGKPIKLSCDVIQNAVSVTLIMATLEPRVHEEEHSHTQPLSNATGRTLTGRELQGDLDDEEGADQAQFFREAGAGGPSDEERSPTVSSHTPVTPLSTSSNRSRASHHSSANSSSKRKYDASSRSSFGNEFALATANSSALLTPQKTGRPSPVSPVVGGSSSPGVAYLGGMSRLRKIIMDEEEEE